MSQAENEKVVQQYIEAINDHDIPAVLELMSEEVVVTWVPVGRYEGKREVDPALEELFTAFPDFTRNTERLVVTEEVAFVEYNVQGTFKGGEFAGMEPTGKKGDPLPVCEVVDLQNEKIVKVTVYWDGMGMARRIGVLPEEGSIGDQAMSSIVNFASKARKRLQR